VRGIGTVPKKVAGLAISHLDLPVLNVTLQNQVAEVEVDSVVAAEEEVVDLAGEVAVVVDVVHQGLERRELAHLMLLLLRRIKRFPSMINSNSFLFCI
jgi:hypothetical protein